MSEFDSELRSRHSFVEETAQGVLDLLDGLTLEDREAFGDRLEVFNRFVSGIIMPNVEDGVVRLPEEYKYEDVLPVIALKPGEKVFLSSDFRRLSPVQHNSALATIGGWQPTKVTAAEELCAIETQIRTVFDSKLVEQRIEKYNFGFAARLVAGFEYEEGELATPPAHSPVAGKNLEVRLRGRPLIVLQYAQESLQPTLIHEMEHAWEAMMEPLYVIPADVRSREDRVLNREFSGFYYGALGARMLEKQGFGQSGSGENNILVDDLRMEFASSPTDFSVRHERLRQFFAELGYFKDIK